MSWYLGELPPYIPILRRMRQGQFSKGYPIEAWGWQSIFKDYGEGMRDWIVKASSEDRKIACHFFVPGTKINRIYESQRDLWHKAWREGAKYLEFSFSPEFDIWYNMDLLEARKLQFKNMDLMNDMHSAEMKLIWLLLDVKAGGLEDINKYANHANKENMRWVATNLQGARNPSVFREMLIVMSQYHQRLDPNIGIVVNGPSSENRIRMIYRIFKGRKICICNAAKIEFRRRGIL